MTKDLVESKILLGKNMQEVRLLLTDDCKGCTEKDDIWMYYTKVEKGWLDAEIEILDIEFKNDTLIAVSIRN